MNEKNFTKLVIDDTIYETTLSLKYRRKKPFEPKDKKKVTAFIPGVIEKVYVKSGTKVKEGDKLLVLEAMKMKNDVTSPVNGVVKVINVKEGSNVAKGELLLQLE